MRPPLMWSDKIRLLGAPVCVCTNHVETIARCILAANRKSHNRGGIAREVVLPPSLQAFPGIPL